MRERDKNNERMLQKTDHETEKNDKKLKKMIEKTKNTIKKNI